MRQVLLNGLEGRRFSAPTMCKYTFVCVFFLLLLPLAVDFYAFAKCRARFISARVALLRRGVGISARIL